MWIKYINFWSAFLFCSLNILWIFWDVMLCCWVKSSGHVEGTCCLHLKGKAVQGVTLLAPLDPEDERTMPSETSALHTRIYIVDAFPTWHRKMRWIWILTWKWRRRSQQWPTVNHTASTFYAEDERRQETQTYAWRQSRCQIEISGLRQESGDRDPPTPSSVIVPFLRSTHRSVSRCTLPSST